MTNYKYTFDGYMIPSYNNKNVARLSDVIGFDGAVNVLKSLGFQDCISHINCSVWLNHFCCIFGSRTCESCSRLSNSIFDYSSFIIINTPFVQIIREPSEFSIIICLLYLDYEWRIISYDRIDDIQCKYLNELPKNEAHFFLLHDNLFYAFSQNSRKGSIRIDTRLAAAFPSAHTLIGATITKGVVVFNVK